MQRQTDYDVMIVGGRVAGSTLAAYLGQAGLRVLILERATLPGEHPASSPLIQPSTLSMLDEIGADESAYARNTPRIHRMVGTDGEITVELELPEVDGRSYAYALDRARFDYALWENALRYETVSGIMGFAVNNLLWDDLGKTVIGVEGKLTETQQRQTFTARVVVGADGRFSLVARKVGAQERDRHTQHPTAIYYAYWEGVTPYDDGEPAVTAYSSPPNYAYGYYAMPSADGRTVVGMEGRADALSPEAGKLEEFYLDKLQRCRPLWARLENATRVTSIHGMKKVGNFFREPGGLGWALTGDAYHQKDPIDGQGIYDAVYGTRALAAALIAWHKGEKTWDEALAWYNETVRASMLPQYETTLNRIQMLYMPLNLPMPRPLLETTVRWLTKDSQYRERVGLALNRRVDPRQPLTPGFVALAMLRGGLRELSEKLGEYETE